MRQMLLFVVATVSVATPVAAQSAGSDPKSTVAQILLEHEKSLTALRKLLDKQSQSLAAVVKEKSSYTPAEQKKITALQLEVVTFVLEVEKVQGELKSLREDLGRNAAEVAKLSEVVGRLTTQTRTVEKLQADLTARDQAVAGFQKFTRVVAHYGGGRWVAEFEVTEPNGKTTSLAGKSVTVSLQFKDDPATPLTTVTTGKDGIIQYPRVDLNGRLGRPYYVVFSFAGDDTHRPCTMRYSIR